MKPINMTVFLFARESAFFTTRCANTWWEYARRCPGVPDHKIQLEVWQICSNPGVAKSGDLNHNKRFPARVDFSQFRKQLSSAALHPTLTIFRWSKLAVRHGGSACG